MARGRRTREHRADAFQSVFCDDGPAWNSRRDRHYRDRHLDGDDDHQESARRRLHSNRDGGPVLALRRPSLDFPVPAVLFDPSNEITMSHEPVPIRTLFLNFVALSILMASTI